MKAGVEKLLVMTRQNHSHLRHVRLRVSSVLSELRPLLLGRVQCLPGLNLGDFASPEGKAAFQAEKAGQEKVGGGQLMAESKHSNSWESGTWQG